MAKLKVFGGLTRGKKPQVRTIVATTSKKRAAELLNLSIYYFNEHWAESNNDKEVVIATKFPEVVLKASSIDGDDFHSES